MPDVILLTESRYENPRIINDYIGNVLLEDRLVQEALERKGMNVLRMDWNTPAFDWSSTKSVLFRSVWDYTEYYEEFSGWLEMVNTRTRLINPLSTIRWNLNKSYLDDLQQAGIGIPPTLFLEKGDSRSLTEIAGATDWQSFILKPNLGAAARNTHLFNRDQLLEMEEVYAGLIQEEPMMLQEYQHNITDRGEVSYMFMGGEYTHAILKKAKPGDFRVQDDFGGTVHPYQPNEDEIEWATRAFLAIPPVPAYGRVDAIWNNAGQPVVSELELVEPELWFRAYPPAADKLAERISELIGKS